MDPLRIPAIVVWIALPTVMYGGYSLPGLLVRGSAWFTPARATFFRAGHAHAGVLLLMALLYYVYLAQTNLSNDLKQAACAILGVGIIAQSGGFFLHMAVAKPGRLSIGNVITVGGAILLVLAIVLLAYGLIAAHV